MRLKNVRVSLAIFSMVFGCFATFAASQEPRRPVVMEGKEVLPLRVLTRPLANVYKDKDIAAGTAMENVPTFQPFYVYTRPTAEELEMEQGWYEVGTDNRGKVIGWMQARDVFEWKQTMCLAYTHPEGRKPVLMFEQKSYLDALLQSPTAERTKRATELYQIIDSQQIPSDFPVESLEPKKAIDITKQFYLLPILNFEQIDIEGREGRLLRLAAATSSGADIRQSTDIRKNPTYVQEVTTGSTELSAEQMKQLNVDVVWVVDTTVSMRPYIDKTLEVVRQVSTQLGQDPETAQAMRFGFWGYRDCASEIPGIEYTTKNYTPELQSVDQFSKTLATIQVTKIDSVDYPEDLFSGMSDGLSNSKWTPNAMRFVILLGDAPGHELNHKWNLSKMDATTLRELADDEQALKIYALHVKEPKAQKYHETAELQYKEITKNEGMSGNSAYWYTDSNDLEGFSKATTDITAAILDVVRNAKHGDKGSDPSTSTITGTSPPPAEVIQVKPISVAVEGEYKGEANFVVDDHFADTGSPWDGAQNVSWNGPLTTITIDLGQVYDIEHLIFQLDTNDTYIIDSSLDGAQFNKFLSIGSSKGQIESGMETMSNSPTHPDFIQEQDQPVQARYLRVSAEAGDDNYAVAELQIFAKKPQETSTAPGGETPIVAQQPKGELGSIEPPVQSASGSADQATATAQAETEPVTAQSLARQMVQAALVEWIGMQANAKAPRDIVAWAVDKDLIDPAIQSMEVRLLINKRQLDSLKTILSEVMAAGRRGQISGEDFFSALQATAATAARDPNQIKNAKSMAQTGLIPEFLTGLPYKSRLMDMSSELWGSWSVDEQDQFLNEVEARIKAYQQIHDAPEGWIALNQGDDPDDQVYPISLELLP